MLFFKSLVSLASLALIVNANAVPHQPRATTTPCEYSCPRTDLDGRTLKNQEITGNTIHCRYDNDNNRSCTYRKGDGSLQNDNDEGRCPPNAASSGTCTARLKARGLFEARANKPRTKMSQDVKDTIERRRNLRVFKGIAN